MKQQAFSYDFTMKELIYFLFKKKRCPDCGGKMTKNKRHEIVEGSKINSGSDPFFVQNAKVKYYYYTYICSKCGSEYKLTDLVR